MRFGAFMLIGGVVLLPALSHGETFHLRDGSTLRGEFVRFNHDTLYVKASFGPEVPIHKSLVLRVDFAEDIVTGIPFGAGSMPQPTPVVGGIPQQSAEPGTLQVDFDDFHLTSEIIVHRGKERAAMERANSIESCVFIGGDKKYSEIDSTTDKEIRVGPDTKVRNQFEPNGYKIVLPAGSHHCEFRIGNTLAGDYDDRFPDGALDKRLLQDELVIKPGRTTQIRIGLRKKLKGLGSSFLYVID